MHSKFRLVIFVDQPEITYTYSKINLLLLKVRKIRAMQVGL